MEYKEIISELQDLYERSYNAGNEYIPVFISEEEAILAAIEALHRLIDLES